MNHVSQKLSVLEKFGYSLGDLAANLVFQTLMTYLAYFYTDIYGLNATDATAIMYIVGTVAAFSFNPIIGALADRTNSKWGKFRPWILYTSVPLGIISVMAFSTPNFSYDGKVIYAVITYSLLLLLYASSNLPYSALSGVITGDMKERNSISSYRFVAVMFAQFFVPRRSGRRAVEGHRTPIPHLHSTGSPGRRSGAVSAQGRHRDPVRRRELPHRSPRCHPRSRQR